MTYRLGPMSRVISETKVAIIDNNNIRIFGTGGNIVNTNVFRSYFG